MIERNCFLQWKDNVKLRNRVGESNTEEGTGRHCSANPEHL